MCSAQHFVPRWMITSTGGPRLHRPRAFKIKAGGVAQVRAQVKAARICRAYRVKLEYCQLNMKAS